MCEKCEIIYSMGQCSHITKKINCEKCKKEVGNED